MRFACTVPRRSPRVDPAREIVRSHGWLSEQPEEFRAALLEMALTRHFEAQEPIYQAGDPPDGLWALADGVVRFESFAEGDSQALIGVCQQVHWFGELAAFDGKPRLHTARAATEATLLFMPNRGLQALLAARPAFYHNLGQLLAHHYRSVLGYLHDLVSLPAAARVAHRLVQLAKWSPPADPSGPIEVRIDQEDLGQIVGLTRHTVSRALRALKAAGLVEGGYRRVVVRDLAGLEAWVRQERRRSNGAGEGT